MNENRSISEQELDKITGGIGGDGFEQAWAAYTGQPLRPLRPGELHVRRRRVRGGEDVGRRGLGGGPARPLRGLHRPLLNRKSGETYGPS